MKDEFRTSNHLSTTVLCPQQYSCKMLVEKTSQQNFISWLQCFAIGSTVSTREWSSWWLIKDSWKALTNFLNSRSLKLIHGTVLSQSDDHKVTMQNDAIHCWRSHFAQNNYVEVPRHRKTGSIEHKRNWPFKQAKNGSCCSALRERVRRTSAFGRTNLRIYHSNRRYCRTMFVIKNHYIRKPSTFCMSRQPFRLLLILLHYLPCPRISVTLNSKHLSLNNPLLFSLVCTNPCRFSGPLTYS